jgi:hypothetical protein
MTYKRPQGIHESQYSVGDKILGFHHQLLLLRLSLVRSVENHFFYPDLVRALRVLIIDNDRGRLGELADLVNVHHSVQSRKLIRIEMREGSKAVNCPEKIVFPRNGLQSLFTPNNDSNWFALLGINSGSDKQPITVDFWDYLAFMPEWGAEVTRQRLIAEVCNTKDVAHSTNNYPTFLNFTNAFGAIAPYFLEIAMDIAYEVLCFGTRVLNKCQEQYQDQISKSLQTYIPIPALICLNCQMPLGLDQFKCNNCNSLQLPPVRRVGIMEQATSIFRSGNLIKEPTGTISIKLPYDALNFDSLSEYSFVDLADDESRMTLIRLRDMKLMWRVNRGLVSHSAIWDLKKTPIEEQSVVFTLTWSVDEVKIISLIKDDGLWEVTSSGSEKKILNNANSG